MNKKTIIEIFKKKGIAILNTEICQWIRFIRIAHLLPLIFKDVIVPRSVYNELLPNYKEFFPFKIEDDYWYQYSPNGIFIDNTFIGKPLYIVRGQSTIINPQSAPIYYSRDHGLLNNEINFTKMFDILSNCNRTYSDNLPGLVVMNANGNLQSVASSSTANSKGDLSVLELATKYNLQNELPIVLTGDSILKTDCSRSQILAIGFCGILEIFTEYGCLNKWDTDDIYRIVYNSGAYLPYDGDWWYYHSFEAKSKTWFRIYKLLKQKNVISN